MNMEITSGVIGGALKILVYGVEGIGKSTFTSKAPNPVYIDTEGSTRHMNVARLPEPKSWMQILNEANYVRDNPDCCKTLVVDTADWAERMCTDQVCSRMQITGIEDLGYGKGYTYLYEDFGKLLNILTEVNNKGINVMLTAHAVMRKFEQPDELGSYDRWELKLQKKIAAMVKEWADIVLFANYETTVVNVDNQGALKGKNKAQGGKRVMYTSHHPCWDAKNRHGLAEKLPFEFEQIAHLFPTENMTQAPTVQHTSAKNAPVQETTQPAEQQQPEPEGQPEPQQPTHIGNMFMVEVPTGIDAEKAQAYGVTFPASGLQLRSWRLMAEKKKSYSIKCSVCGYKFAPCAMRICTHPAVTAIYGHDSKAYVCYYECQKCRFAIRNDYDGGLECRWDRDYEKESEDE